MNGIDEQLCDWWDEYQLTHDSQLRDRLVLALTPMIAHIVACRSRSIPAWRDVGDVARRGLTELVSLLEDYEHCEVTLEEYAWTRVNQAVIDELRRSHSRDVCTNYGLTFRALGRISG